MSTYMSTSFHWIAWRSDKRLAEGDALLRPLHRHVERALHLAQRVRAAQQPVVDREPPLAQREALADFAEHVLVRHVASRRSARCTALASADSQVRMPGSSTRTPGFVAVHQEHRDAAALALLRIGDRLHHQEVAFGGVRDPHLGAVQHPVIALAHGPRLHHAAGIGAGIRPRSARTPSSSRLRSPGVRKRSIWSPLHSYRMFATLANGSSIGEYIQLLEDCDLRQHRQARSPVLLRHHQVPQAGVARQSSRCASPPRA